MARKPKLGTGKRFAMLEKKIAARGDVRNPAAVAAAIGRKKYGKERFQKLAAAGRKHSSHHELTMSMPIVTAGVISHQMKM